MPGPLVVIVGGAAFGVVSGYAFDRAVVQDEGYSSRELAVDAGLGAVGGGIVKPGLGIIKSLSRHSRTARGKLPSSFDYVRYRATGHSAHYLRAPPMFPTRHERAIYTGFRSVRDPTVRRNVWTLTKGVVIVGGDEGYYLYTRRTGPPSGTSPTGPTSPPWEQKQDDESFREASGGSSTSTSRTKKKSSTRKARRPRRRSRCPPGHYWNGRKCVKRRKAR